MLLILGWCTSCSVGALETSAPPWRHPNHLCRSVKSVGEYTQQEVLWVLWIQWENIDFARLVHFLLGWCTSCSGKRQSRAETSAPPWRHPNHLCKSVKSVGEYTQQEVLWVLWIPWENILSKDFCEICVFCGRPFAAAEAGYLRYYENLWENIRSKCGFGGRAYGYRKAVMPLPQTCNSVTP